MIQKLRAGDIAKDLRKFGEVGSVEIKQRCVIVTMEKDRDAYEVMRESKQRSGRIKICGESFVVDEFRENAQFGSVRSGGGRDRGRDDRGRDRSRRRDSRDRSSGNICSDAEHLIKKIQKDREMSRDLDWRKIEMRLTDLNSRLQVKALETYMDSDFKAIRKPMGWITSIISTLAMGLDHGSRPHDGGFKKSRGSSDSYRYATPRSDEASPRTQARRRGRDSRSPRGRNSRSARRRKSSRSPVRRRTRTRSRSHSRAGSGGRRDRSRKSDKTGGGANVEKKNETARSGSERSGSERRSKKRAGRSKKKDRDESPIPIRGAGRSPKKSRPRSYSRSHSRSSRGEKKKSSSRARPEHVKKEVVENGPSVNDDNSMLPVEPDW